MESAIEGLIGRELNQEERQMILRLRDQYGYSDDDPLVIILALTGAIKIIAEDIPAKIVQASEKATELHLQTLREQSMMVARDMVGQVAGLIHTAGRSRKDRVVDGIVGGIAGMILMIGMLGFGRYFGLF